MTKFQKLTKKEKVEHIWEYYRYHIIGGVIGVFMTYSLLMTIFGPKPPEPAVNIVVMGIYVQDSEKIDKFKEEIKDIIENDEERKVEVNMFPVDWESSSPMDIAMNQKLVLMFQAKEIDIMIIEEPKFDSFIMNVEEGIYESLEEKEELKGTLENNKENLVKRKLYGDIKEKVYGLSAKDNMRLQGIGLRENYIVTIPRISDNIDNAVKAIKWLYE